MKVKGCFMDKFHTAVMLQVPNIFCTVKGLLLLLFLNVNYVTSESKCFIITIQSLKNADCRNKNLKMIPTNIERDIKVLMFEENKLTLLRDQELSRYILLQEIDLTRNQISTVHDYAFMGLDNLQILDLEGNELKAIPALAIARLTSLRKLNLKSNQIRTIPNNSLSTLINLQELNFENNYITQIDSHAFFGLSDLEQLNIVENDLTTLNIKMNDTLSPSLEMVRLHDNPWHCDCHLRWFRDLLETRPISWKFYHNTPKCDTPEIIQGATWKQLSSNQFACAAESNVKKNSTNIQLIPGKNVTIDCFVQGDPIPQVTWFKNEFKFSNMKQGKIVIRNRHIDTDKPGELGVHSTLVIANATEDYRGDYKCLAQNNGGRSEVTYNVWVKGGVVLPNNTKPTVILFGLNREVFLAILISAGLLIVVFFIVIIVCILVKQNRNKHAYKVREYHRSANHVNNKKENSIVQEQRTPEKPTHLKQKESKSDRKHLLAENKELPQNKKHQNAIKNDESSKPLTQTEQTETLDNEFRMKIFASYEEEEGSTKTEVHQPDHNPTMVTTKMPENINQTPAETNQKPKASRIQHETPDLLKDRIITNRAIPVPPPSVPNHISSAHPRAKENPYVTASELKAASMKRKTASADDLLDGREPYDTPQTSTQPFKRSSSRDDVRYSHKSDNIRPSTTTKKTRFKEPPVKHKDHASVCTNPVCLKDQPGIMDNPAETSTMKPYKPILNVHGKGGRQQREVDLDHIYSQDPRYDYSSDMYRTMPARMSRSGADSAHRHYSPPGTSQSSPAKSPLNQRYLPPATKRPGYVPMKTVSFSEEGHPIIDLTQEMPEPIVISGCKPDNISRDKRYHPPQGASTLPRLPPQHVVHKTPLPNGSPPTRQAARTASGQCTTLDDLLSPPFGQSPKSQRHNIHDNVTPRKKILKPGEKDEFGTAV